MVFKTICEKCGGNAPNPRCAYIGTTAASVVCGKPTCGNFYKRKGYFVIQYSTWRSRLEGDLPEDGPYVIRFNEYGKLQAYPRGSPTETDSPVDEDTDSAKPFKKRLVDDVHEVQQQAKNGIRYGDLVNDIESKKREISRLQEIIEQNENELHAVKDDCQRTQTSAAETIQQLRYKVQQLEERIAYMSADASPRSADDNVIVNKHDKFVCQKADEIHDKVEQKASSILDSDEDLNKYARNVVQAAKLKYESELKNTCFRAAADATRADVLAASQVQKDMEKLSLLSSDAQDKFCEYFKKFEL